MLSEHLSFFPFVFTVYIPITYQIKFLIILLENIQNLPFSFPIKHVTTLKISVTLNPLPDIDLCVSH